MTDKIVHLKDHVDTYLDIRDLAAHYFEKYPDHTAGILILFDPQGRMLVKPCKCPMSWMAWAGSDLLKQSVSGELEE